MTSTSEYRSSTGFTLTEIVLCVAIISSVLVAVVGILPVGMDVSRKAVNHTVVATVLEDLHNRLQGVPLQPGEVPFSPAYYDDLGVFLPPPGSGAGETAIAEFNARRVYRADVTVTPIISAPAHTSQLFAVRLEIGWPVDAAGSPVGSGNPQAEVTFVVTSLTGSDWKDMDPSFEARIEH